VVWRLSWPRIFCTVGRLIPLLQGRRGERVPEHVRAHVLGESRSIGHRLDDVLGAPRLDQERLLQREVVLQERPHTAGHRHHADLWVVETIGPTR